MAVLDHFCNPKMLSQGDEKINPYNSLHQNFFYSSTFSYLKTWFKKTDSICNFFVLTFSHYIVCLITKNKTILKSVSHKFTDWLLFVKKNQVGWCQMKSYWQIFLLFWLLQKSSKIVILLASVICRISFF